jgi:hypothetical protein
MIRVIDQGCQTHARTADFFITALGEFCRDKPGTPALPDDASTMNLRDLAASKGFDWHTVCVYARNDTRDEAVRWFKAIEDEWDRRNRANLNANEYAFAQKVFGFQDVAEGGRFRVYGEMRDGGECIVLVTEFVGFTNDDETWQKILALKQTLKAHLWVMMTDKHLDKYYPARGEEGERKTKERVPGRGKGENWFVGPNHGRMERQVELSWRIEGMTPDDVVKLQKRIKRKTARLWREAGVCVS